MGRSKFAPRIGARLRVRPKGFERADAINIRIPIQRAEKTAPRGRQVMPSKGMRSLEDPLDRRFTVHGLDEMTEVTAE